MGLRNRKTNRPRVISQTRPIQRILIDACCLIDLLASGEMEVILGALAMSGTCPKPWGPKFNSYDRKIRPSRGHLSNVAVDLTPHIDSGVLSLCQPDTSDAKIRCSSVIQAIPVRRRGDVRSSG